MKNHRVLVIDNEPLMREFLCETLRANGCEVSHTDISAEAMEMLSKQNPALVFADVRMLAAGGSEILKSIRKQFPQTIVVVMAPYSAFGEVFCSMKEGAFDYIIKPFSSEQIEIVIKKIEEYLDLKNENRHLRLELDRLSGFGEIIGQSKKMEEVFALVKKASESDGIIIIRGENGTGKELIAREIHRTGRHAHKPFVKLDCTAVPQTTIQQELFGCEKDGSLSGNDFYGNCTVLLKEAGSIPYEMQCRLLEALNGKAAESVEGAGKLRTGARIICTLSNDPDEETTERRLFNGNLCETDAIFIEIPPLRDHLEDISHLADYFIKHCCAENKMLPKKLSKLALSKLMAYSYPGNVRELRKAIEYAVMHEKRAVIQSEQIMLGVHESPNIVNGDEAREIIDEAGVPLLEMERRLILKTLKMHGGSRGMTADTLKISVRTLRNKLNQYREMGVLSF
jgi:two-component system, NtrC family, response regulator AtoC